MGLEVIKPIRYREKDYNELVEAVKDTILIQGMKDIPFQLIFPMRKEDIYFTEELDRHKEDIDNYFDDMLPLFLVYTVKNEAGEYLYWPGTDLNLEERTSLQEMRDRMQKVINEHVVIIEAEDGVSTNGASSTNTPTPPRHSIYFIFIEPWNLQGSFFLPFFS